MWTSDCKVIRALTKLGTLWVIRSRWKHKTCIRFSHPNEIKRHVNDYAHSVNTVFGSANKSLSCHQHPATRHRRIVTTFRSHHKTSIARASTANSNSNSKQESKPLKKTSAKKLPIGFAHFYPKAILNNINRLTCMPFSSWRRHVSSSHYFSNFVSTSCSAPVPLEA